VGGVPSCHRVDLVPLVSQLVSQLVLRHIDLLTNLSLGWSTKATSECHLDYEGIVDRSRSMVCRYLSGESGLRATYLASQREVEPQFCEACRSRWRASRFSSALASWFKATIEKIRIPVQFKFSHHRLSSLISASLTATTRACIVAQSGARGSEWSCVGDFDSDPQSSHLFPASKSCLARSKPLLL
jgi:hypothetical protein